MTIHVRRREFITLLGSAAAAWPVAARAQQIPVPVIGYLGNGSPEASANRVAALRKGLNQAGYVEGINLTIQFRWADNDDARLPELAADLVRRRVTVFVTANTSATVAAKSATATIPIVFNSGGDPVKLGLVASFNRPGGNITGLSGMTAELGAKRLGLLHELLPSASRFAMLLGPSNELVEIHIGVARAAAAAIGRQMEVYHANTGREIDAVFTLLMQNRIEALLVPPVQFFTDRRVQLATLTARHAVPAIYATRENTEVGGLMSYGPSIADQFRQIGLYVGRILKGEKAADLPVMQPTKFELIINLATARALGIEVPSTLLALADEVIE
jgi:putative ABC transport system substrate-binding protein